MKLQITILLVSLFLFRCNSDEGCFSDYGNVAEFSLNYDEVSHIILESSFEVEFGYSSTESILILTGENYFKGINTELKNGNTLILRDDNKCKFIKDHNSAKLIIKSPYLERIDNYASGSYIKSVGTWQNNSLRISSTGHSSIWEIDIDNNQFQVICNDISTFKITGKSSLLDLQFASSDGRFEGSGYTVETAKINHNGTNDVIFNVSNSIEGTISNTGNIIYSGNPSEVNVEILGRGNLKKK